MLLILDNLEQDLAAAALVARLLGACPGLSVLATNREALRLRWERLLLLPSLGLPGPDGSWTLATLSQYESIRLFVSRAQAARALFVLDERNAPAVAQICSRLEGVPLAIELAAARTRAFSPEAILGRLETDLDFLDSGGADLPARQRTLRAVEAWSYALLAKPEKAAFRALGIFSQCFTVESAEAVFAAGEGGAGLARKAAELVSSLVDKSLVAGVEGENGALRYRLLEILKAYARERLAHGREAQAVAIRRWSLRAISASHRNARASRSERSRRDASSRSVSS
jgi:predicted ATPase